MPAGTAAADGVDVGVAVAADIVSAIAAVAVPMH